MAQKIPIEVLLDAWYLKHESKVYDVPVVEEHIDDLEWRVFEHVADYTAHQHQKGVKHLVTRYYPAHLVHVELLNDKILTIAVQLRGN